MENLNTYMNVFQFVLMIGAAVFAVFFYFSKPDERASRRLSRIETECPMKHNALNLAVDDIKNGILNINETFLFFQRNDFKHIEDNSRSIDARMSRLEGQNEVLISLLQKFLDK